jgi:hypothetical protein
VTNYRAVLTRARECRLPRWRRRPQRTAQLELRRLRWADRPRHLLLLPHRRVAPRVALRLSRRYRARAPWHPRPRPHPRWRATTRSRARFTHHHPHSATSPPRRHRRPRPQLSGRARRRLTLARPRARPRLRPRRPPRELPLRRCPLALRRPRARILIVLWRQAPACQQLRPLGRAARAGQSRRPHPPGRVRPRPGAHSPSA